MSFLTKGQLQEDQYRLPYHYSDIFSEEQKLLWKIERRALLRLIIKQIGRTDGLSVMDVGCGDGRLIFELMGKNVRLIGVDISPRAISYAKAFNPGASFYKCSINSLRTREKFDRIVLMEVMEHFPANQVGRVLSKLKKLLKTGGSLIITTPSTNLPLLKKHEQHFTPDSLQSVLGKYCSKVKISGYQKNNWQRKLFVFFRNMAFVFYPFRNRLFLINRYYKFIENYYDNYVALGKPSQCDGLVAICTD